MPLAGYSFDPFHEPPCFYVAFINNIWLDHKWYRRNNKASYRQWDEKKWLATSKLGPWTTSIHNMNFKETLPKCLQGAILSSFPFNLLEFDIQKYILVFECCLLRSHVFTRSVIGFIVTLCLLSMYPRGITKAFLVYLLRKFDYTKSRRPTCMEFLILAINTAN